MEPKGTILLVEDERMVALAEARALEQEGYAVVWASSGGEALERIAVSPLPDLVLMDMNLGGGLDGLEVARAILRQHDLPVVFLSSHTDRETVERSRQITSYGYVVKGTGTAVLLAAVETARELFSARRGVQESRRLYRDTVLSVQEGIAVLDQDLRYVVWNRFMEELTGISAEELLGRSVEECPFPLWDRGTDQFLLPALQGERVDAEDTPFFAPATGRRGWVRGSFAPRRDAAGRVSGVLVTVGDLTTRKQSEEVLRRLAAIV
ncbi:MAG TPA: response regulator, partial [Synergistaceae bacterium]|nr:response regulator [Synergistaceae bacterium]